jgi:hypothetical protein
MAGVDKIRASIGVVSWRGRGRRERRVADLPGDQPRLLLVCLGFLLLFLLARLVQRGPLLLVLCWTLLRVCAFMPVGSLLPMIPNTRFLAFQLPL